MKQTLILPINRAVVTASMGNAAYQARFGFPHYGTDLVSAVGDPTVYASGVGTLVAAGWDRYAGNTVIIRYPGAVYRPDGSVADVIFRYFHLAEIARLPTGENAITKDTVLGQYGGSGMGSLHYWSPHLHVEADTDVRYPRHSPTFLPNGGVLFGHRAGATAATLRDCLDYLYQKPTAPDHQTYRTAGAPYVNRRDFTLPVLPE